MAILYALVARGTVVLAEFTATSTNASTIAKQILEKVPGNNNDSNVSYSQDRYVFHVKRTDGLTVLCMAEETAGRTIPFTFLEDIHQRFVRTYGRAVHTAQAYAMNDEFSRVLSQQIEYYSNDPNADRINRIKGEMSQVRDVMIENIDKVLDRGERLELLVDKTATMQGNTFRFRKQARRFRSTVWWRNCKLTTEDSYTITGRVRIPASTAIGHAAKFSNIKVVLNGGQNITFLRPDGYFTFHKVPAGTHLIEVYALGFFFSPNTSKPSLIMAFFSCLAWLYVAGRLWQDAQHRVALNTVLRKNLELRPKALTVDDKLMVLGCKDLERRIVETEMELAQAKSQGYLKNQKSLSSSSSGNKKMLAVIGVYTGFGSHLKRNKFRGSWMPRDDALKKLEERGVIIRFVIGRSANRGDSLDRKIDQENLATKDFLILENHEEAQEELPKKVKFFYSAAVQNWDAEFYVKVDDNVDLDLEGLIGLLESRRGQDGAYIGCMKSGDVVTQEGSQWYEPEWWKFGDDKSYFRHATGSLVILSKNLAQYININSGLLKTYAFDDTTIGSWMIGVQATYIDDNRLCCSSTRQEKVCSMA
ncbi:unnamed protein product [Brassica oleracea var. botrytis]